MYDSMHGHIRRQTLVSIKLWLVRATLLIVPELRYSKLPGNVGFHAWAHSKKNMSFYQIVACSSYMAYCSRTAAFWASLFDVEAGIVDVRPRGGPHYTSWCQVLCLCLSNSIHFAFAHLSSVLMQCDVLVTSAEVFQIPDKFLGVQCTWLFVSELRYPRLAFPM